MIIAFDVDDTLIIPSVATGTTDVPNYDTIELYGWFQRNGDRMIIWSGGGESYAKVWAEKLGLKADIVCAKTKENAELHKPDIAFDDSIIDLGKVNYRVKRINNQISRKIWNERKIN